MTENKAKLKALVEKAQRLLETRGDFFTEGSKLAITDMIRYAALALEGEYKVPFVRNREFVKPEEEAEILFNTKRFTMAPTYNINGMVYHYYGLEPALEWFEKQDVLYEGKDNLPEKAKFVIKKGEELLKTAVVGTGIGDYDFSAGEKLKEAIENVKKAKEQFNVIVDGEELGKTIVQCFNKIKDFRFSRILRTDIDPSATLYMTEKNLQELKETVEKDTLIKEQYEQIKKLADSYSLDYIEKVSAFNMTEAVDYNEMNKYFYVWSSTDKIVNFKAPKRAVKATISFILPSEENEQDGLGHVWVDNLEVLSASGSSLEILNSGFDEGESIPLYWKAEVHKGNPVLKWEGTYPYCGGGEKTPFVMSNQSSETTFDYKEDGSKHSIYICNPTPMDEGAWSYENEIALKGGMGYTLTFNAKIDGKFKKGLKTVIIYKDEKDNVIEVYEYYFNRKSTIRNSFLLTMQCDAVRYAFSDDINYALKAKKEILYILNDFCQGAEHWLITNLRPEGSDAYGAVQGGRVLSSIASTYSMIKKAQVFSKDEKEQFYEMTEYLLRYMLDLRDRTELTPVEAQQGCSNWQTDMCAGTAFMMLVLEDFPYRKSWLYNAIMVLKSQLELNVNPDSSWPESIRYHHAALERFAGFAKVLKNVTGENWFAETSLGRMFGYSLNLQTPGYRYFDGHIGTPPFGDHALGGGVEFSNYRTYLGDIEIIDKNMADKMYYTWCLAGKPFKRFWGESIVLDNTLGKGSTYEPSTEFYLDSTKEFVNSGVYVFRKNFGKEKQSYFAIMSSPQPIGHGHLDQGSFIIYKDSIPIIMDSGIEGYFDSSTNWHISSYSHACFQFETKQKGIERSGNEAINLSAGTYSLERGWVDVPRTSRVLHCSIGGIIENIAIEIMNPEGKGKHIREVWYIKEEDLYIIRDKVEDFHGQVQFNLPVAARNSVVRGKSVFSQGIYDVDLETVFLSNVNKIELDKGRSTTFYEIKDKAPCMMDYIRATADAREGFLTLIYPKERWKKQLEVSIKSDGVRIISLEKTKVKLSLSKEKLLVEIMCEGVDNDGYINRNY